MPETPGKTPITVESLMEEELYGLVLLGRGEQAPLGPDAVARKLRAAEDFYEHALNIRFGERRIKSNPQARGIAASDYDIADSAYDYPPDFFDGTRWGYLQLNHRPVKSVEQLIIAHPGIPPEQGLKVPTAWIQPDYLFGRVQIIATTGAALNMSLFPWMAGFMSGGVGVPRAIFIDYTAGFSHDVLQRDHNDLLEGVRLRTLLTLMGIISQVRTGGAGSRSLSQDGQSESTSFAQGKWGPYSGTIELAMAREQEIRDAWTNSQQGAGFYFV